MADSAYPELSDRALGWLRFLWDKATTPDDWSINGRPNAWWDDRTGPPTELFARFDLSKSTYAVAAMADQTPAWREGYTRILSELIERHTSYWASVDWITQIGIDPDRENYPAEWIARYFPPEQNLTGNYDMPGWAANGIEPWGLQPDPIAASGNMFFRSHFLKMLALYSKVSGDDKWEKPFPIIGYGNEPFNWSTHGIAEYTSGQWATVPHGPHCENTKVWPYCISVGGLGLQLYDKVFGTSKHDVYHDWTKYVRKHYMGIAKSGALEWFAFYYDPIRDFVKRNPPLPGIATAWWMLPQSPQMAEFIYEAAMLNTGWSDPRRPISAETIAEPRMLVFALMIAQEIGDTVCAARIRDIADNHFGGAFFGEEGDRFAWWFNIDEKFPRGQTSAMMMLADVGQRGAWTKLFTDPVLNKFNEPTVEGVDFPALAIRQAWNDLENGVLSVRTVGTRSRRHEATSFTVSRIPDPSAVVISCDGNAFDQWEVSGDHEIRIRTTLDSHSFLIYTGYFSKEQGDAFARSRARENNERARQDLITNPVEIKPKVIAPPTPEIALACCPSCK